MFNFNGQEYTSEDDYAVNIASSFHGNCWLGHADKVQEIVEQDLHHFCDLNNGLLAASEQGRLEVVRYLLTKDELKKDINLYVPYEVGTHFIPSGLLLRAYYSRQMDVVDFLLYDLNYEVCRDTKNFLEFNKHDDLLQKIEKRDLFFKMSKEFNFNVKGNIKPLGEERKPKI